MDDTRPDPRDRDDRACDESSPARPPDGGPPAGSDRSSEAFDEPPAIGDDRPRCPRCGAVLRGGVPGRRWCLRCDGPPGWDAPAAAGDDGAGEPGDPSGIRRGAAAEGASEHGEGDAEAGGDAPRSARARSAVDVDAEAGRALVRGRGGEPWTSGIVLALSLTCLLGAALAGRRALFRPPFAGRAEDGVVEPVGFGSRLAALVHLPLRVALWTAVAIGVLAAIAWFERRPLVRASALPGGHEGEDGPGLVRRVAAVMAAAHLPLLVDVPVPVLGFVVISMLQAVLAIGAGAWLLGWSLDRAARWIALTVLAVAASLLASHGVAWVLGPPG